MSVVRFLLFMYLIVRLVECQQEYKYRANNVQRCQQSTNDVQKSKTSYEFTSYNCSKM